MAHVLIVGASKGIGLETTRQALAAGHHVRALARSADRIPVKHASLERRRGDALNAEDVAAALEGIDGVIQALGVAAGPDLVLRPVTLFSRATRVLAPAMRQAGVKRLISVTGFGAGESEGRLSPLQRLPFRLILGRAYADKSVQEELIKNSGLDWTIVRPGVLTNGAATSRYRVLVEPHEWRNGVIARSDVAHFLVGLLDDTAYVGKAPVLIRCPL